MSRLMASSANSRGVQASTGRPESAGGVQARLMIWTICSAVNRQLCGGLRPAAAPFADGLGGTAEVPGQRFVALARGGGEDNAGPQGERLGAGVLAQQAIQDGLLRWGNGNREWLRTRHEGTLPWYNGRWTCACFTPRSYQNSVRFSARLY